MNLSFNFEPQNTLPETRVNLPVVDVYNLGSQMAPETPVGPAYRVYNYLNGIMEYETHRKGCTSIKPELAKKIPKALRQKWYFECDNSFVPLFYLYHEYRLTAELVAAVEGPAQLGRFGSLGFIYKHSREQVLQYMLNCPIAAAVYDFENGISRNLQDHWEPEGEFREGVIALYTQKLITLRQPTSSPTAKLITGVRVRFEQAIYFEYQNRKVAINDFTVKRNGSKVLFIPDGFPFAARVVDHKERQYCIIP